MMMTSLQPVQFTLSNFRGPLEFLYQLVQRKELNICDIPLQDIASQFLKQFASWEHRDIDAGAEFVGTLAAMAWVKSRALLPSGAVSSEQAEEDTECRLELLKQLIEYCRFKEASKELLICEEKQFGSYPRGIVTEIQEKAPPRPRLGLDQMSFDELSALFQQALSKAPVATPEIRQERWKVSDKIRLLKEQLSRHPVIDIAQLFSCDRPRQELITLFLAILEMMKTGIARLSRAEDHGHLILAV